MRKTSCYTSTFVIYVEFFMPEVEVSRCGSVDSAMRKLKRILDNNQIPRLARDQECHIKPTEKRKNMRQAAEKRLRKKNEKSQQSREWSKQSHKLTLARQKKNRGKKPARDYRAREAV